LFFVFFNVKRIDYAYNFCISKNLLIFACQNRNRIMIVCIAEKPSVAKDIARILGATASHDGYMEGNGYQVTWTFGHLCELKMPEDYTPMWKSWSLSSLPMIPSRFGIRLKEDQGIKKQFATIERLMSQAEGIINCGDAGQEGELIQRWVMQKAQAKCPVQRLWISSMTDEAIREGFQQLKDQSAYQTLYLAGLSRAVGDWLLGINCTRLYTIKYGQNRQVLSIGRVQTPTLALIVSRQKEIDNFKPEPYWVLATVYRDTVFTATQGRFTKKEEGEAAFATIEGKPFTVTKVEKKEGKEAPPSLYDLTSLQVDCNRKFGFSAEMTLNLIQQLYEQKLTTYPRVDTTFLSDDVYAKCPQIMNGLFQTRLAGQAPYAELVKPLGGKALPKSKKVFDSSKVTDHHAIIPTGIPPQGLADMQQKVYDLIARRFIAAFYPDCKYAQTTVLGEVSQRPLPASSPFSSPSGEAGRGLEEKERGLGASIEFKVTGRTILDPGWRVVYATSPNSSPSGEAGRGLGEEERGLGEAEERTLPAFTKGESGPHTPTLTEKMTTPPPYYTEATLLRAMETAGKLVDDEELRRAMKENGIGRPSTRAAIIETLFKRHYIRKERKRLVATPTGIELIDLIREELLKSAELTGIWEKKLRDIEAKKYDAQQFIDELKQQVTEIVRQVIADPTNRRVTVVEEPKKAAARGEKVATSPTAVSTNKEKPKRKRSTKKNSFEDEDSLVGQPCPLCGQGTIIKGKTAYGCSRWKEGCTFRKPF
jgi:DNA topoisomerase-3